MRAEEVVGILQADRSLYPSINFHNAGMSAKLPLSALWGGHHAGSKWENVHKEVSHATIPCDAHFVLRVT